MWCKGYGNGPRRLCQLLLNFRCMLVSSNFVSLKVLCTLRKMVRLSGRAPSAGNTRFGIDNIIGFNQPRQQRFQCQQHWWGSSRDYQLILLPGSVHGDTRADHKHKCQVFRAAVFISTSAVQRSIFKRKSPLKSTTFLPVPAV